MNRYVFCFYKKGNMRFISHLDLQTLFKRIMRRADIDCAYTQGFNPHSKTNIVQPLSLGFEAEKDYFEFDSNRPYELKELLTRLNAALPEGIKFTAVREIPVTSKFLSPYTEYSEYKVFLPTESVKLKEFLAQPEIIILKRDKKTKKTVEKNVKNMIYEISEPLRLGDGLMTSMIVRCASNETLNPLQLAESLLKFSGVEYLKEDIRISRTELYYTHNGTLRSIFEK